MGALQSLLAPFYLQSYPPIIPGSKVLISGCDSGFGRWIALKLARQGYNVFAGCLTKEGRASIEAEAGGISSLFAFPLDVTKSEDITACAELISRECPTGLNVLVNNAGIVRIGFIAGTQMSDFRDVMEVNYFGAVALTKAMLPHLLKTHGHARIISITSVESVIASPLTASYSGSKFALRAFMDALRVEIYPWNIPVITIAPGSMKTPMTTALFQKSERFFQQADVQSMYGEAFTSDVAKVLNEKAAASLSDPEQVVNTILLAVTSSHPSHTYYVGTDAHFVYLPLSLLPTWVSMLFGKLMLSTAHKPATALRSFF